jgi:hypothetical protein
VDIAMQADAEIERDVKDEDELRWDSDIAATDIVLAEGHERGSSTSYTVEREHDDNRIAALED